MNKQRCYWLNTRGLANAEMVKVRKVMIGSVQFSLSVVSDSLQPHGLQHARLPCPSPAPRACSNSCPSSQWCHLSSLLFPSPPAFNLSQHHSLFQWVGSLHQVAKVLELQLQVSVLPMNIQDWFHLGLTDLISLLSKGLLIFLLVILIPACDSFNPAFHMMYSA